MMQVPKKHFPTVGLAGLLVIGLAAGSIVYYQYVAPPNTSCGLHPVHRLIFMTALIKERGGYNIFNAAILLNQTSNPLFSTTSGANLTDVNYRNYKTNDNTTIFGNIGDTITLYIKAISTNETGSNPVQQPGATGHGFTIDTNVNTNGTLPNNNIAWGTWYSLTFAVPKVVNSTYHCTQFCSQQHPSMNGGLTAACG